MKLEQYTAERAFAQKHLLCLQDWTPDEILQALSLALKLKGKQKRGENHEKLKGKSLAMIFEKSSTRTRVSFEVGMQQLGGHALFLSSDDLQLKRSETVSDTARVLSRYVDGIMIRTYRQEDVEDLAMSGSIPVINGLTDAFHPCQALADILTVYEHRGTLKGLKLAYLGDGNNVAHSLMIICSKLGVDFAIGCAKGYDPKAEYVGWCEKNAAMSGSKVEIFHDPADAVRGADVVYTDVWASMGQEKETPKRHAELKPFQVNETLMKYAKPEAIFMHCLPAHRGEEVTAGVIDGRSSVVFDEAENRLHVQKAVMQLLMEG